MSDHSYQRILSAFMAKPWAILPEKLAQLSEIIALRIEGGKFTEDEILERIQGEAYAAKKKKPAMYGSGVAVIPVYGVITPRADMMTEMSGGTSMNTFIQAINQAVADPQVASILLEVDSPGGQVDGVPEAAAAIRAARAKKPVTAVANTMAASAAYWLASQASDFVISPSAEVGSIGVFAAHNDMSEALAAQGVKTTLISAGKYKTELSPYEPLTDEARAAVQQSVDDYYAMFAKDVAAGRRVTVGAVKSGFGEGRMLTSARAVEANMADRVDTFEGTLQRMVSQAQKNGIAARGDVRERYEIYRFELENGETSPDEIREAEGLPALGAAIATASANLPVVFHDWTNATTAGMTDVTSFTTSMWPVETPEDDAPPEDDPVPVLVEEVGAKSDRPDAEPLEQLDELRRKSRKAAISEREEYLSLLRRMT